MDRPPLLLKTSMIMENKRVTYAAVGLMEFVANVAIGKAVLRVSFTGGSMTQYGITPATFSTNNPIYQRAIENSAYFKNGRIQKLREVKLEGEPPVKIAHNPEKAVKQEEKADEKDGKEDATDGQDGGNATTTEEAEPQAQLDDEGAHEDAPADNAGEDDGNPVEAEPDGEGAVEGTGIETVEVAELDDAAEYLKEHFGIAKRNVRSKEAAEKAGEANGVKFVWVS